jgi:hypothetical protein
MKTVSVSLKELKTAADRWYEFHGLKSISTWHYLKYLGEDYEALSKLGRYMHTVHRDAVEVSEESARKIRMLNSENYKTLLAMYKAQNMIE